jgi:hypothetical protein
MPKNTRIKGNSYIRKLAKAECRLQLMPYMHCGNITNQKETGSLKETLNKIDKNLNI